MNFKLFKMMYRSSFIVLFFLLSIVQLSAQNEMLPKAPMKEPVEFSDKMYRFFMSPRLKKAITQRDSLNSLVTSFNKDTTTRGTAYRNLQGQQNDTKTKLALLNTQYNDLMNTSLNKTEQLNEALRQKQKEIAEKERLLTERELKLKEMQSIINRQDSLAQALNDIVKKALYAFTSDEFNVEVKNGKVYVSLTDKLLFRSGKAEIEPKGTEALKKLAEVMNNSKDIDVMIEGHTDNIPIKTAQFRDNWDLSVVRAVNVLRVLEDSKVNPVRMIASGRGEFFPKATNSTAEGRALNRRTEIILTPKLDLLYKALNQKK
jgi:chemotaxis protein MotB